MIKVNIVAVGKVKEKYFQDGIDEYSKRLQKFCQFNIIEITEENYKTVDKSIINTIKEKEADKIIPHLKGKIFAMAIEGKKISSQDFSGILKDVADNGGGVVTFVIGGSYGLSDRVKRIANGLLSFSEMTFPHTLFRLMLSEQIYRGFSILSGNAYHK